MLPPQSTWLLIILGSPGPESWEAIENGDIEMGGRVPINPLGSLIGLGHPVDATQARILLDSFKQTTGNAIAISRQAQKTLPRLTLVEAPLQL